MPGPPQKDDLCDPDAIQSYLAGSTTEEAGAQVEEHLSVCGDCRSLMESLAGTPEFWEQASSLLDATADTDLNRFGSQLTVSDNWQVEADVGTLRYLTHWLANSLDKQFLSGQAATERGTEDPTLGWLRAYEVLEVIGIGGMGLVLKAYDHELQRLVSIKTLRQHLTGSVSAKQRFLREAQLAARVKHRNIVEIYSIGEWEGIPYLVMPYFAAGTLAEHAEGPYDLDAMLDVLTQVTNGLCVAHDESLVHRDIKPSNILLADGLDHLVLSDFGLARSVDGNALTVSGTLAGTPQFMSPEQARGESVDARSDLFSLGSLLYWLATGQSPFAAETSYGTLSLILNSPPPKVSLQRPELPLWFERMIGRLLAKDPSDRIQSARELRNLLADVTKARKNGGSLPAQLVESGDNIRRSASPKALATTLVALVLVLFVLVVVSTYLHDDEGASTLQSSSMNQSSASNVETADAETVVPADASNSLSDETEGGLDGKETVGTQDNTPPGLSNDYPHAGRMGALDVLDEANFRWDLKYSQNLEYWLERMSGLESEDVSEAIYATALQEQRRLEKQETKVNEQQDELKLKVLNSVLQRNPFQASEEPGRGFE